MAGELYRNLDVYLAAAIAASSRHYNPGTFVFRCDYVAALQMLPNPTK
jgi:hypothetical protein